VARNRKSGAEVPKMVVAAVAAIASSRGLPQLAAADGLLLMADISIPSTLFADLQK
jgi:hypothetical protein